MQTYMNYENEYGFMKYAKKNRPAVSFQNTLKLQNVIALVFSYLVVTDLFFLSYRKQKVGEDHFPEYLTIYIYVGNNIYIKIIVLGLIYLVFFPKYLARQVCSNAANQEQTLYHLIWFYPKNSFTHVYLLVAQFLRHL